MGISTSIFLLAVGAVLAFAVEVQTDGIDLNAVGVILMIIGGLGILFSLLFWSSWGGFGRQGGYASRAVVAEQAPVVVNRTEPVVVERAAPTTRRRVYEENF